MILKLKHLKKQTIELFNGKRKIKPIYKKDMKKHLITTLLLCCTVFQIQAQSSFKENIKKAKKLLNTPSPFDQQARALPLLQTCIEQGNAEAENMLGMLYLKGIAVEVDLDKAFLYISTAAHKNYDRAQYNLGRMYKYGMGCEIDFNQAIRWFEKATSNGNQRAAYSLGYMAYKGFGIKQDYSKAVYWFERSQDPMAKHFLGLCYYLGYGVSANTDKALEILLNNTTLNSKTLVNYIKENQKESIAYQAEEALNNDEVVQKIASEFNYETPASNKNIEKEELVNEWIGKIVQYDWSGQHLQRILPIELSIAADGDYLNVNTDFQKQEKQSTALWQDQTLYIENLNFTLDKLYAADPKKLTLDYTLLAANLTKQEIDGVLYLTGSIDSYIEEWTEYGEPMSLVLHPKNAKNVLTEEALLSLSAQESQFIKLYPVPFKEQLLIQYNLQEAANVQVEIVSFDNNARLVLDSGTKQAGEQTVHTNPAIKGGRYIVRIHVNGKVYTRMLIKEN